MALSDITRDWHVRTGSCTVGAVCDYDHTSALYWESTGPSSVVPALSSDAQLRIGGPITTGTKGDNKSSNGVIKSLDHAVMVWTAPYGISVPE